MVAQFGQNATEIAIRLLGLPLAAVAVILPLIVLLRGLRVLPRDARLLAATLAIAGLMFLTATLVFADIEAIRLKESWAVGQASRYSVAPGILIGQAVILAAAGLAPVVFDRWLRVFTVATLILAFIADSTGDPWNSRGPSWADSVEQGRRECIAQSSARVQMTPTGVPKDWSADIACSWLTRP